MFNLKNRINVRLTDESKTADSSNQLSGSVKERSLNIEDELENLNALIDDFNFDPTEKNRVKKFFFKFLAI